MKPTRNNNSLIQRLKKRWGITTTFQVAIILIVFACTGFSVLYAEELILEWMNVPKDKSWWAALLLFIFITLPLYNLLLLIYGFIFGQFRFFWKFEKRFFARIFRWRKNRR